MQNTAPTLNAMEKLGDYSLLLLDQKTRTNGYKKIEELKQAGLHQAGLLLGQYYTAQGKNLEALKHFKFAAEAGIGEAFWGLASLEKITGNKERWFDYCIKSAENNGVDGQNEAGNIFNGRKDYDLSMYWYMMAYIGDHSEAEKGIIGIARSWMDNDAPQPKIIDGKDKDKRTIGRLLLQLFGKFSPPPLVLSRLSSLAENNSDAALFRGSLFESSGQIDNATEFFGKSANMANPYGARLYGDMLASGKGCSKNLDSAFSYYQIAAESYVRESMFVLGERYRYEKKRSIAAYWYIMSYASGFEQAGHRLEQLSKK